MPIRRRALGIVLCFALAWVSRAKADDSPAAPPPAGTVQFGGVLMRSIEPVDANAWKHLTDAQQTANVKGLKEFADQAITDAKVRLKLVETPHFLIYSEVFPEQTQEDAVVLETAYGTLSRFLGLHQPKGPKDTAQGTNIWRGKAVIFIFRDTQVDTANRFHALLHPWGDDQSAPELSETKFPSMLLTVNGNGAVDAVTMQSTDRPGDEQRLVFAMALAFMYRLHTPRQLDPWVEAGLAGALENTTKYPKLEANDPQHAAHLIEAMNTSAEKSLRDSDFQDLLENHPDLERRVGFFGSLTVFMLRHNPRGYAAFVMSQKDGQPWEKSLQANYGASVETLRTGYLASLSNGPRQE